MALAGGGCWWAKKKRCSRSLAFKCKAWTRLSKTCVETLIGRPCSNQVYQSTLTPESCATSARLSPGARRLLPRGSPTSSGASRALLVRRKSPSSCKRWSSCSRPIVPSPSFVRLSSWQRRSLTPMINTHLVLVSLSVYTFDVSKTTFEDKDMVSMHILGHGTLIVGRDASATETPTLRLMLSLMEEFPMRVFVTGA